jgi:hypothetical protein
MKIIAIALLFPIMSFAESGYNHENTIMLHISSRHMATVKTFNEKNSGAGFRYGLAHGFLMAGIFENSLEKTSIYAGGGATLLSIGPISIGLSGGLVTGYADSVRIAVIPEISAHYEKFSLVFSYLPAFTYNDGRTTAAITMSTGLQF